MFQRKDPAAMAPSRIRVDTCQVFAQYIDQIIKQHYNYGGKKMRNVWTAEAFERIFNSILPPANSETCDECSEGDCPRRVKAPAVRIQGDNRSLAIMREVGVVLELLASLLNRKIEVANTDGDTLRTISPATFNERPEADFVIKLMAHADHGKEN